MKKKLLSVLFLGPLLLASCDEGPSGELDSTDEAPFDTDTEQNTDDSDSATEAPPDSTEQEKPEITVTKVVNTEGNVTLLEMPDWDVTNDVCGFTHGVTLGEVADDGMIHVPANHPAIRYMGRVDCSDPTAPVIGFPAVSIRASFEGTGIDMILTDSGSADQPNFFNIIVDDEEPVVLEATPGEEVTYPLARDLEDGVHSIEIYKRIEGNAGKGRGVFGGFRIMAGTDLLPVEGKPHRLEVIGDSISCGYGNELTTDDPDSYPYTTQNSNAYTAWTAVAARDLNAEYMAVAYSGRGIHRNYSDQAGKTMPEMYLDALPFDDSPAWQTYRFTPEVLVINLGTNDFSPGIDDVDVAVETYELTFLEFVETLRSFYPDTIFILAVGPMLTDAWPSGYRALSNTTESLENVVAARQADGDENVYLLELPSQSSPYGEDWHPTNATHLEMAEHLMGMIDDLNAM